MARSTDTDRECLIDFANDSSALVYPLRIMACTFKCISILGYASTLNNDLEYQSTKATDSESQATKYFAIESSRP